jgi:hypothetical protein
MSDKTKLFIEKSRSKFGDKYSYENTIYVNQTTRLNITCPIHGSISILPDNHLNGCGCSPCSKSKAGSSHKLSNQDFIERAKSIHGDNLSFESTFYSGSLHKVTVTCKIHGDFLITASNLINNKQGCRQCSIKKGCDKKKTTKESLLNKISNRDGFRNFDFSKVKDSFHLREELIISCSKHGEIKTNAANILRYKKSFGCAKCRSNDSKYTTEEFVQLSHEAHNGNYSYAESEYKSSHEDVSIICQKHGSFLTKAYIHLAGGGKCPKCTNFVSSYEIEISKYLSELNIENQTSVRNLKDIKEIDILIPKNKIAIEFNGLYWHSEQFKDKNYHLNKTKLMSDLGYKLIHIFEDEWIDKKEICKSMLLAKLGLIKNRLYARKCKIVSVDNGEAKEFLNKNHIQGFCPSKVRLGLVHDDKLVFLMTFGANRKCLGQKNIDGEWELLRMCSAQNVIISGAASKILSFFKKNFKYTSITSFCDKRWSDGESYLKLGFEKVSETKPNYFYFKGLKRYNRFGFRKDILVKNGYDKTKSESYIMNSLGYKKIYDCGSFKFKLI